MPKILLVEDNDINRDMLSRRLERKGYEVIVATDGAQGVTKTLSDLPDLILMDIHLPILDGWEATRQIKANPQTRVIPVIALTADAIAGEREKALAAGCNEYDTKPVDFPRLLEKITKLLEPPTSPPAVSPPPKAMNSPTDQRLQRILRIRLRRELDPLIHGIISYSEMLLDTLSEQQNLSPYSDIQKIYSSGMQLLRLIHAILNPALVEIQQQEINLLAPVLRLELLTPLSTIIGYCEMLLEEAPIDLIPDLEQIHASAQGLLGKVKTLDNLIARHLESIQALGTDEPSTIKKILETPTAKVLKQRTALELHQSLVAKDGRILIVDDAEYRYLLLSRQLESQGCQMQIATTSQQALNEIATLSYDLILLEVSSPEIDGLQLLEQIKEHREWQHIPVLMIAANDEMETVIQGMAMKAADYLTRPLQSVLLRAKVTACLERKRLYDRGATFDSLLENAPVGAYQATITGNYRCVNSALVRLLGYSTAITLTEAGTNIAEQIYVDSNQYTKFKSLLEQQDQVTGFEYQAYRYDQEIIWLSEYARAVRDSNRQFIYYEGIVVDITHHKRSEADLEQQLTEVQLELEQIKQSQQVAEITQTNYFQQLQSTGEAQENFDRQATSPVRVLLVEDNELNCDMLSRRLQRYGYSVMIANDGAEGVSKALSEQPDVILMDISLPVMDGWEATQHIKDNPETRRIPVIALTAHAMAGDREKALAAGCNDYDMKPIDLPRLLSKIEGCLKRSGKELT